MGCRRLRLAKGSPASIIEARALTMRREDGVVLDDVSFRVDRGEVYCLLANSPASKAVIDLFSGVAAPTSGDAVISTNHRSRAKVEARPVATFVTRETAFYPSLSVRSNVEFFVRTFDGDKRVSKTAIDVAMQRIGVAERYFDRAAADVRSLVRLRVWLSIALLRESPALFLHDPTRGLDDRDCADLLDSLLEVRRAGTATFIGTSDVPFARAAGDRVGILKDARKVAELSRSDLNGNGLAKLYLEYFGHDPETIGIR